MSTSYNQ